MASSLLHTIVESVAASQTELKHKQRHYQRQDTIKENGLLVGCS